MTVPATPEAAPTGGYRAYLDFALELAAAAGEISLRYFQKPIAVESKSDNSPVTIADRTAEQAMRSMIAARYPDHGVIGEEFGEQPTGGRYTWVLDPIDGTKSFIHGVPLYGVLVALLEDDQPVVGVATVPALREMVYAARGGGCFSQVGDGAPQPAHVSTVARMDKALLLASEIVPHVPAYQDEKRAAFARLCAATHVQRTWGDTYGYLLVTTGRAEIALDAKMQVWDCAPFGVILPEAGGTFTDWAGVPTIRGGESIATNGALFDATVALSTYR